MMRVHKKQKITLFIGFALIVAAVLVWIGFGGEIFTKTQVLVEKQDELLGTTYKEWEDKFVLGLDYAAAFSAVVVGVTVYLKQKRMRL